MSATTGLDLLPHHRKLLDDSQIDEKFIVARGYRSVEDPAELAQYGFLEHQRRTPCMLVPHYNLNGDLVMHMIRPDDPRRDPTGKIIKYDRPPGIKNFLDVNPAMPPGWINDHTRVLLISEGARKIDSVLSEGHACIGVMGVWGFRTKSKGSTIILPDFRLMQLLSKTVLLGYDSDSQTKIGVYLAQLELADLLESLYPGCSVGFLNYDPLPEGFDKVGLDDWRQAGNTVQQLIDTALPTPVQPPGLDQRHDLLDFYAVGSTGKYLYTPTCDLWAGETVDKQVAPVKVPGGEMKPTKWLSQHQNVQGMTWSPGDPQIIVGKFATGGGWKEKEGARLFNEYTAPMIGNGDAKQAQRWLDHTESLYPEDMNHILAWFAHRVQKPQEKTNHALLFGGMQGVGKDAIVEPLRHAVGTGNFKEATPARLMDSFKPFLQAVVLRISELRDMGGDTTRWGFYEHMKTYTESPPTFIEVNRKNLPEITIPNVLSVIYTTKSRTDGLYLPVDDWRHYVMWTDVTKESYGSTEELAAYFRGLYDWYEKERGNEHVSALLRGWDISQFDAKAPPKKTDAWWQIVSANIANESSEISFALEEMGWPPIATMEQVIAAYRKVSSPLEDRLKVGGSSLEEWASDRKNWKAIPKRFEEAGYVRLLNRDRTDGRWRIGKNNVNVFAKMDISTAEQLLALADLQSRMNGHGT